MEAEGSKWRFTPPTHTVRAFHQALLEVEAEGGVEARAARYRINQRLLVAGMTRLGFEPCCPNGFNRPSSRLS
jgi:2-aminoethylphosphonate-pyruvate transaminase